MQPHTHPLQSPCFQHKCPIVFKCLQNKENDRILKKGSTTGARMEHLQSHTQGI
jgi:hypothetical protein